MAITITTMSNWTFNYLTTSWFPQLTDGPIGKFIAYIVLALGSLCVFGLTFRYVPETKDRPIEENVKRVKNG